LIDQLRTNEVSGQDIGDILTEVAVHVQETGETPQEAFGDPVTYAERRGTPALPSPHPYLGMSMGATTGYIVSGIGGVMAAGAAWALGAGDARWGPLPTWLALVVGLVLMLVPLWVLKPDLVTDPRTGKPLVAERKTLYRIATGFGLGAFVLIALAGWYFTG
jgi:hypothetical protein